MAPVFKCAPMMWICWTLMLMLTNALHGCTPPAAPTSGGTIPVVIAGKTFTVEVAADDAVRMKGMGGRTSIAEDGGMIFAFARSQRASVMTFVMRDCPIDIDIIYLDSAGRVQAFYEMKAEPPRGEGEGTAGDFSNAKYEGRLRQYSSKYRCTFAIELKAGTIKKIGVKDGDLIVFDADGLKKRAK